MIFKLQCIYCKSNSTERNCSYEYELTDERVYELNCKEGHESVFVLNKHKFELLFDMGLYALNDGYSREAVTNFAVSIEHFHEFCIEALSLMHGVEHIPDNKIMNTWQRSISDFDKEYANTWKQINLTERQLGAYNILYFITFKHPPTHISKKYVEFRNNVVHKGIFPSRKETLEYAKVTFEYIKSALI